MKFFIKIIFILLFFAIPLLSCTSVIMSNSYNGYVNQKQLDSLCKVERIPTIDAERWISFEYMDPDDNTKKIHQYTYIKSFLNKEVDEIVYVVTNKSDSTYKFTKRVTTKNKK